MSQSPQINTPRRAAKKYEAAWSQLYEMLRAGKSLSGRERNCCFLNIDGEKKFADISSVSGLDAVDDARAVSVVDWDHDGDLDLWISNRTSPRVRFFRNESRNENHFLQIRLQGKKCNRDAIGARVELYLKDRSSRKNIQTVRAGGGFLAQSSKLIHFGLGSSEEIDRLEIHWPGSDNVEIIQNLRVDEKYLILQGSKQAQKLSTEKRPLSLKTTLLTTPPENLTERVVIVGRLPLPKTTYLDESGSEQLISHNSNGPLLVNLWASWCKPCLNELNAWSKERNALTSSGLEILALNVDHISTESSTEVSAPEVLSNIKFPFRHGKARREMLQSLVLFQKAFLDYNRPFPIPSSFLIDKLGRLVVLYKGPVEPNVILQDLELLKSKPNEVRGALTTLKGRWLLNPPRPKPLALAASLAANNPKQAVEYLQYFLEQQETISNSLYRCSDKKLSESYAALGAMLIQQGDVPASLKANHRSIRFNKSNRLANANLGSAYFQLKQWQDAILHYTAALDIRPGDVNLLVNRGLANLRLKRVSDAHTDFNQAIHFDPNDLRARYNLSRLDFQAGDEFRAVLHLRHILSIQPEILQAKLDLAWILATSSANEVRNGNEAIRLAEDVCKKTNFQNARALHALAVAWAENGDFAKAIEQCKRAIVIARSQKDHAQTKALEEAVRLFEKKKPFHRKSSSLISSD